MTFLIATLIIIGLDMSFLWFIPAIIVYAASVDSISAVFGILPNIDLNTNPDLIFVISDIF